MYLHARYYDPATGQFLSPDTIVPEPGNVLAYNRYLYAYGNPLRFSDATGHCATLEDGSPDSEGDAQCWLYVDELWKSWNANPQWWEARFPMTRDEFVAQFAYHEVFDEQWMGDQLLAFWGPQYQQWQIHHDRYNPPPVMNPPQNQSLPPLPGQRLVEAVGDDFTQCRQGFPLGCGRLLDSMSVGTSAVAVGCSVTGLAPCVAVAGTAGRVLSTGSVVINVTNTVLGDETWQDASLSLALTVTGEVKGPRNHGLWGLGTSVMAWLLGHREDGQ